MSVLLQFEKLLATIEGTSDILDGPNNEETWKTLVESVRTSIRALETENARFREALELIRIDVNTIDRLQTRVVKLEAELARVQEAGREATRVASEWVTRAEKAEAKLALLEADLQTPYVLGLLKERDALKTKIEGLEAELAVKSATGLMALAYDRLKRIETTEAELARWKEKERVAELLAHERFDALHKTERELRDATIEAEKERSLTEVHLNAKRKTESELARVSAGWREVNGRLERAENEANGLREERDALGRDRDAIAKERNEIENLLIEKTSEANGLRTSHAISEAKSQRYDARAKTIEKRFAKLRSYLEKNGLASVAMNDILNGVDE